jgi:hypothetical protein
MDKSLPFVIDSGEPFENRKDPLELEENESQHDNGVLDFDIVSVVSVVLEYWTCHFYKQVRVQ